MRVNQSHFEIIFRTIPNLGQGFKLVSLVKKHNIITRYVTYFKELIRCLDRRCANDGTITNNVTFRFWFELNFDNFQYQKFVVIRIKPPS